MENGADHRGKEGSERDLEEGLGGFGGGFWRRVLEEGFGGRLWGREGLE
jgi:hypothetical protein